MKFKKDADLTRQGVTVTIRGMNQLIGALRQVDYTDTSERNMHMIDGLIRVLAYMHSAKNVAHYWKNRIPDMNKQYQKEIRRNAVQVRKLKAQIERSPEMYPPTDFMIVQEEQ